MKIYRNIVDAVHMALGQIFQENRYADKVIEHVLKQNPKWGSRDRRFIAETSYEMVRWWRLLNEISPIPTVHKLAQTSTGGLPPIGEGENLTQSTKQNTEGERIYEKGESYAPSFQIHGKYILSQIKSGMILIHQQRAHERILYERFLLSIEKNRGISQQLLFPQSIEFSAPDFEILKGLNEEIKSLGFDINIFGKNTFVINGIPGEAVNMDAKELLEKMLENYKNSPGNFQPDKKDQLARALAKITSIKTGMKLEKEEMVSMIDELFACEMPYFAPNGKPTIITLSLEDLEKKFQ